MQPPIVEIERTDGSCGGTRQPEQQYGVPDEHLEQQRDVADQFDIEAGKLRKRPVGRQARHTDCEAEQGRENDAERRDQERVEQPHRQRSGIGVARRVCDQRFADRKARPVEQETEPRPDIPVGEIVGECHEQGVACRQPSRQKQPGQRGDGRSSPNGGHRIGNGKISPPSRYSLFCPRSTPSGVMWRSKISP